MALSNYDMWAINEKGGDAANGMLYTPLGICARLYKDWLYIDDPTGWTEAVKYVKPTVAEIHAGVLCYKDLHVCVQKKDGVFFVAAWTFTTPFDSSSPSCSARALYGVSRYAFEGETYVGVTAEHIQAFYEWLDEQHEEEDVPLPYTRMRAHP